MQAVRQACAAALARINGHMRVTVSAAIGFGVILMILGGLVIGSRVLRPVHYELVYRAQEEHAAASLDALHDRLSGAALGRAKADEDDAWLTTRGRERSVRHSAVEQPASRTSTRTRA